MSNTGSAARLVDLITAPPGGGRGGSLAYELRHPRDNRHSVLRQRYLKALAEQDQTAKDRPVMPQHPINGAHRLPGRKDRENGLTQADLIWLERLPREPEKVAFADAQQVAELVVSVDRFKNPGDARLLDAIWNPINDFHARHVAKAQLAAAKVQPPRPPEGAEAVVAEAIQAEIPELTEDEARGRAAQLLAEATYAREAKRQASIETAQATIDRIDQAAAERAQVTA